MIYYVGVDVGCIECGESTRLVCVSKYRGTAHELYRAYCQTKGVETLDFDVDNYAYFDGGQHEVLFLEINVDD